MAAPALAPLSSAAQNEPSLTMFPAEIILTLMKHLGPRSVKRLGTTCRQFGDIAADYLGSRVYAEQLARSAIEYMKRQIIAAHAGCFPAAREALAAKAGAYAYYVAEILALINVPDPGSPETPLSDWSLSNLLHVLYPVSVCWASDWALAPYALDWCTSFERRILGCRGETGARIEIRALLYRDAFPRLLTIAKGYRWDLGVTYLVAAEAMCSVVTAATASITRKTLEALSHAALTDARAGGQTVLCMAALAAVAAYLPRAGELAYPEPIPVKRPSRALWKGLGSVVVASNPSNYHADDAAWLNLVGLASASEREPLALLKSFVCSGERPQGFPRGRSRSTDAVTPDMLSNILRMALGDPAVSGADPRSRRLAAAAAAHHPLGQMLASALRTRDFDMGDDHDEIEDDRDKVERGGGDDDREDGRGEDETKRDGERDDDEDDYFRILQL